MNELTNRYTALKRQAQGQFPELLQIVKETLGIKDYQDKEIEVRRRLELDQKSKHFKDTEYVEFTKKYQRKWGMLTLTELSQLEKTDPVAAYKAVEKYKLWPKYDPQKLRDEGNTSGAAYLKVKLQQALSAKTEDNEEARRIYVASVNKLIELLENAKDVRAVIEAARAFRTWFESDPDAKSLSTWPVIYQAMGKRIFGQRFLNALRISGDIFSEAMVYESLAKYHGEERQKEGIQDYSERIKRYEEQREYFANTEFTSIKEAADIFEKKSGATWRHLPGSISVLKNSVVNFYTKQIESSQRQLQLWQAGEDWSWATTSKPEGGSSEKLSEPKKITKAQEHLPLKHIIRKGGLVYPDSYISEKKIQELFGYKNVVFGNYMDNKTSRESVKHFVGAMLDLGEILNIDIKKLNERAGLTISFGSMGSGSKAAAAYYPSYKAINLTKSSGDGAVAHEWAHFLDNTHTEGSNKSGVSSYSSEDKYSDFKNFVNSVIFYEKPMPVKVWFERKDIKDLYNHNNLVIQARVNKLSSIDELIDWFRFDPFKDYKAGRVSHPADYIIREPNSNYLNQAIFAEVQRTFGAALAKFDMGSIEVEIASLLTPFYLASYQQQSYGGKPYWLTYRELFARAFESVIKYKLRKADRGNNYLVSFFDLDASVPWIVNENDLEIADEALDKLIRAVKEDLNISGFVIPEGLGKREDIDKPLSDYDLDDELDDGTEGLGALPISTARAYYKLWINSTAPKMWEDYFGGKYRIYLPIKATTDPFGYGNLTISGFRGNPSATYCKMEEGIARLAALVDDRRIRLNTREYLDGITSWGYESIPINSMLETLAEYFTRIGDAEHAREAKALLRAYSNDSQRNYLAVEDVLLYDGDCHIGNYVEGMAYKLTAGKRQHIKIGKVLNKILKTREKEFKDLTKYDDPLKFLIDAFSSDPIRQVKDITNKLVVISRHPYDIAGASTDRNWESCMTIPGRRIKTANETPPVTSVKDMMERYGIRSFMSETLNYLYSYDLNRQAFEKRLAMYSLANIVPVDEQEFLDAFNKVRDRFDGNEQDGGCNSRFLMYDIEKGSLVAYLVNPDDRNIEHPISRITIRPYSNGDGDIILRRAKTYGARSFDFEDAVQKWIDKYNADKPEGRYYLLDLLYADNLDEEYDFNKQDTGRDL